MPRRLPCTRSTSTRPTSAFARPRPQNCTAAMLQKTRRSCDVSWRARRAPRAMSSCSMRERRCSSPVGLHRCARASVSPQRPSTPAPRVRRSSGWCALAGGGGRMNRAGSSAHHRGCDASGSPRRAARRNRWRHWSGAPRRRTPRGNRFEAALGMAGRVNVIAECKRRSPSRGVLAARLRPCRHCQAVRSWRRGGDLGADRADVLRRRARASARRSRRGAAAAAAQGLHRRRIPVVRGAEPRARMRCC